MELSKHFDLADFSQIDHGCYRVADLATYHSYKTHLEKLGTLLSEAKINGRPIASYKFHQSVWVSQQFSIDLIELPAPRGDAAYSEGFEHIEVVTSMTLERFIAKYPQIAFNKKNLNAKVNRDITLKFSQGLVKFHERSLEAIIEDENKM